uniref:Uncharacterized protein n=1 Tax=Romanomermis culicivorax TaxID=13658 RepID=A0A915JPK2_ROMCU
MFFACKPGKMTRDQHLTALNFSLFSFLLSLFILCLFLVLRTKGDGAWNWRNATMIIIFLCMVCIYIFQLSFGWLWTGVLPNILVPMEEEQLESAKSLDTSKTSDPLPSTDQHTNTKNDVDDKFFAAAFSPSKETSRSTTPNKYPHLSTNVGLRAYDGSPFRHRNMNRNSDNRNSAAQKGKLSHEYSAVNHKQQKTNFMNDKKKSNDPPVLVKNPGIKCNTADVSNLNKRVGGGGH